MTGIVMAAILLVVVLSWSALQPIKKNKGFSRVFSIEAIKQISVMEKKADIIDFAGYTENHLYFKTKRPDTILVIDNDLKNIKSIFLKVPDDRSIYSRFTSVVDSPYVHILAGNTPAIITGKLEGDVSVHRFPNTLFTRVALISGNLFALRMVDKTDQIFAKANPLTGQVTKENNVSEKNHDAGISTDGVLHYDKASNFLVYVYHYKNEILLMDTGLNVINKVKTVDINTSSEIIAGDVKSKSIITNLTPKRVLNAVSCVWGGSLYNNSRVFSDNEAAETVTQNSVIDVYNIKDGSYQKSFYIPNYKGQKVNKFKVVHDKVFAIYKDFVVAYNIAF
ncbi:MAG: hypothetical protein DI539_23410 [Flavobacterium psychrophilum]|nr:MAG: hypothetical protein DI539_23410 [Flavobacterium psychrophilum]